MRIKGVALSRRAPRRRHPLGPCVLLAILALGCGYVLGEWDGRQSQRTLHFRQAAEILQDPAQDEERRRSALGVIYRRSELGARAVQLAIEHEGTPDGLRDDLRDIHGRIRAAWSFR